jgi:hypothetical protein
MKKTLSLPTFFLLAACSSQIQTAKDIEYIQPLPIEAAQLRIKNSSDYFIKLSIMHDVPACQQEIKLPEQSQLEEGKSLTLPVKGGQAFAVKVVSGYSNDIISRRPTCEAVAVFTPQVGQKYVLVYGGQPPTYCTLGIVKEVGEVDGKIITELEKSFKLYRYRARLSTRGRYCLN